MRLGPIRPAAVTSRRLRALTNDSHLRGIVLRMVSLNALSAFAQDISRTGAATPVRSLGATGPGAVPLGAISPDQGGSRTLEAVPPAPGRPLPRGSLLDLKV